MTKLKKILISLAVLLLALAAITMKHPLFIKAPIPVTPISNDLNVRGKQLRVALDMTYKEIAETHTMNGQRHMDITSVITPYISIGMTFDDAELTLRSAGFEVGARPGPKGLGGWTEGHKYDVAALIMKYTNPYLGWLYSTSSISIVVDLTPQTIGDYTKVLEINASIVDRF